jgi:hypothetical protein
MSWSSDLNDIANAGSWDTSSRTEQISMLKKYFRNAVFENPVLLFQKGRLKSAIFKKMKNDNLFIEKKFRKIVIRGGRSQSLTWKTVNRIWNEKEFYYKRTNGWTLSYIKRYANIYKIIAIIAIAAIAFLIFKKPKKSKS